MTCIVGLKHEGDVYIGGDSAGVDTRSYALSIRADRKVFSNGPIVAGFTSSFRMGQLLRYKFDVPKLHPDDDLSKWMATDFIDAARTCFKDGGFARKNDEEESGGTLLVGVDGRLFSIYDDYQVAENVEPYAACGCGAELALGYLFASTDKPPEMRIKGALSAAERFSAGVRSPFHVEKLVRA